MYKAGAETIQVGYNGQYQNLSLKRISRHGLITGATGTGKTTTLRVLAESFSSAGIPVFCADVKGDLSGIITAGDKTKIKSSLERLNDPEFECRGFPTIFWDVFGEKGHPLRATISELGPLILSNALELSEVQAELLQIIFQIADESELLLLDMKDIIAMVQYVSEHNQDFEASYGKLSVSSLNTLLRKLKVLESEGGSFFFGEPALEFNDLLKTNEEGYGYISILECQHLIASPKLYVSFMLWLLSSFYEKMEEVGDLDKPKLVFFFDEAHLLFNDIPASLLKKVEQIVRLIRSKGVGVYFCTQTPDLPESIMAQLGNRFQHALRAYTPNELKKIKAVADTFRSNPEFDTQETILNLGIGEALVSFIDDLGVPSIVERTYILPPQSNFLPLDDVVLKQVVSSDDLASKYDVMVDRESAYEMLLKRLQQDEEKAKAALEAERQALEDEQRILEEQQQQQALAKEEEREAKRKQREKEATINSFKRSVYNTVGRELSRSFTRTLMGIFKK